MHFIVLAKDCGIQVAAANCLSRDALLNEASHVEQPPCHEGTASGWILGTPDCWRNDSPVLPSNSHVPGGCGDRQQGSCHQPSLPTATAKPSVKRGMGIREGGAGNEVRHWAWWGCIGNGEEEHPFIFRIFLSSWVNSGGYTAS